ncbi:MAG: hypothetical protein U0401_20215 [Anaerolineae bacterium]
MQRPPLLEDIVRVGSALAVGQILIELGAKEDLDRRPDGGWAGFGEGALPRQTPCRLMLGRGQAWRRAGIGRSATAHIA